MKWIIFMATITITLGQVAAQGTTAIRTFVNGTGQEVKDLHIEYSRPLNQIGFLGAQANRPQAKLTGNRADFVFTNPVAEGSSVTIWARTENNRGLAIKKWWWTNDPERPNTPVGSINSASIRGDETREERADKRRQDNFTIINKGHHWGGSDRNKQGGDPVKLTMNIDHFLAAVPEADKEAARKNILAALKQWADCTKLATAGRVPKAGENNNPMNAGAGKDPPVMAPGPTHRGGAKGSKFRSVTKRECDAIFIKYRNGLEITVVDDEKADIRVRSGVPRTYGGALGAGPTWPAGKKGADKHRTGHGFIFMTKKKKVKWHYAKDTDGDGFITNKDTDTVPKTHYDFYSIFKHEIGHVLCFNHSGVNFTDVNPHFNPPGTPKATPGHCPGCRGPHGHAPAESEEREPGEFFFSSKQAGGEGGYDIWSALPDPETGEWTFAPLGPTVNTPDDEMDPHLAVDGTTLLFSSNRPDGLGGFDLYETIRGIEHEGWDDAEPMTEVNSEANELSPTLTADMKSLLFVSDRPGGQGGLDVYSSELVWDQDFSFAANLGAEVNSPQNEFAAAINATGDGIVISSDRPGGVGEADLYLTVLDEEGWIPPQNLGEEINSPGNELDPSIRSDHNWLFFVSDRNGEMETFESFLHPLGFDAWLTDFYPPGELPNPELVDPLSDPDGDGHSLLTEYAFSGHPLEADGALGPEIILSEETAMPLLKLAINQDAIDIDIILQGSPNLKDWQSDISSRIIDRFLEGPNQVELLEVLNPDDPNRPYFIRALVRIGDAQR